MQLLFNLRPIYSLPIDMNNAVEQSHSWEANSSSAKKEVDCIFSKANIHYRVHNSSQLSTSTQSTHFHRFREDQFSYSIPIYAYVSYNEPN
jgi:hypothetical protein